MKDSMNCRVQADAFRALAQELKDEAGRAVLLQLSQAWEVLAGAWDSLSAELEPAHQRLRETADIQKRPQGNSGIS